VVGIVLVSHSQTLVEGLRELVTQLTQALVPLALAGGGPQGELGTSATAIAAAIRAVAGPDGVLVLLDLGSAVLSAEAALDLLDPAVAAGVQFSDAPLVEGAVLAVIHAGLGDSLAAVAAAAESARHLPKIRS
jgi:dihydroxyacetone kinase phosphotransfer subunit